MNILVIAPHPDDEVVGCGGALCLHARRGDRITVIYLTSGELGLKKFPREKAWEIREAEARDSAKILGLSDLFFLRQPDWMIGDHIPAMAEAIVPILKAEVPGLIYLPHQSDWHPDHQAACPTVREALKLGDISVPELRAYEVWTPLGEFDEVVDISPVMSQKLRALRAHRSQLDEFQYLRAISGLNQYRGVLAARVRYAEVFKLLEV